MIKISDRFYIDADTKCYALKEKTVIQDETSKNYGNEVFKDCGYYTTIEDCLAGILKLKTREFIAKNEINSIEELKKEIIEQKEFLESLNLKI